MNNRILHLLSAEIGEGASDGGCKWGAATLREHGLLHELAATARTAIWGSRVTAHPLQSGSRLETVERFSLALARAVRRALHADHQPLVVGGDHSCAVGTWSAVADHLRPQGPLGLVWVDAHLDAHTPETSDSQAPHGMPLAALLGHGSAGMTHLYGWAGKLRPAHVAVVGARSFEHAEQALLAKLGVRVMFMDEVRRRGFAACFAEARAIASQGTAGWGISFDLDGLDPQDAPGTGTPVPDGIPLDQAMAALTGCGSDSKLCAVELTEYNPLRDFGGHTAQAATQLVCAALGQA